MNLPNKITLARIAFIPVFVVVLFLNIPYKEMIAAAVFILLALSDVLDGYIARKNKQVTTLGGFLDPLADKLLVSAALIFLIGHGVEAWMAFVIIAREFAVTGLRILSAAKNMLVHASAWGKAKTASQIIAIVAVLINLKFAWWLMLIAVILTIISGIDYFRISKKLFKEF